MPSTADAATPVSIHWVAPFTPETYRRCRLTEGPSACGMSEGHISLPCVLTTNTGRTHDLRLTAEASVRRTYSPEFRVRYAHFHSRCPKMLCCSLVR